MAPHAHKDRTKHDRDGDKWETPAEALVVWFLARLGDYGRRVCIWWFCNVCPQSLDGEPPGIARSLHVTTSTKEGVVLQGASTTEDAAAQGQACQGRVRRRRRRALAA